jgi:hypothetical protein
MAQYNTVSTLDGLFKTVYGEGPVNVVPECSILQKKIKFESAEKIGKAYNFPVILSNEAGVTYLAAGAGVSTLNDAVAAVLKEATVDANQIIVRGQMDYEAAAKAEKGKEAFKSATELLIMNLQETASKRLEIAMLYGRSATGLGTADSSTNQSATQTRVLMLAAGWAPGIWSGLENATFNFYKVSDNSLISSAANAIFTLAQVDFTNRYLYFDGTSTGISALDTALAAGDCYIHFKDAKSAEMYGIDAITVNTGTLFGISATTYGMWTGSSYGAGSAALTTAKILNAVGYSIAKGGLLGEADVLVSPKTFMNLSGSMTDLRRQNGGQKETEGLAGFETITLMGPNGKLNLIPHPFVKEGEAFILPMKQFRRIGTKEFTFQTPGKQGEMFLHIPDKNCYELRNYTAQAIICLKPAQLVKITAIVNS